MTKTEELLRPLYGHPASDFSPIQKTSAAVACAAKVFHEPRYDKWAADWLSGADRSYKAAEEAFRLAGDDNAPFGDDPVNWSVCAGAAAWAAISASWSGGGMGAAWAAHAWAIKWAIEAADWRPFDVEATINSALETVG